MKKVATVATRLLDSDDDKIAMTAVQFVVSRFEKEEGRVAPPSQGAGLGMLDDDPLAELPDPELGD